MELLKDYNCEILYHPGKVYVVADALSRKQVGNMSSIMVQPTDLEELDKLVIEFRKLGKKDSLFFQIEVRSNGKNKGRLNIRWMFKENLWSLKGFRFGVKIFSGWKS